MTVVDVRLLYIDGCPNWRVAGDRLERALGLIGWTGSVGWQRVETEDGAAADGFGGSPTILVDGEDLFSRGGAGSSGLTCRLYETPTGLAGSPTVEDIARALVARRK